MPGVSCPHCQAGLSPAEVSDGWCASCGKRWPPSVQRAAAAWADVTWKREVLRKAWGFVGWLMAGVVLGLAGLIASRLLFGLPRVHEPEKPLGPWLMGAPVGGGIVFSAVFLILARWYPRAVRVGLYLAYGALFVIACAGLVMRLRLGWFK